MSARINYVEFPVSDLQGAQDFYAAAFGWTLTGFGPSYAATTTGDVDIGLQADPAEQQPAPLPVVAVDDLETALVRVTRAGGRIVEPIFAFPGGRRFHLADPAGNIVAVAQAD